MPGSKPGMRPVIVDLDFERKMSRLIASGIVAACFSLTCAVSLFSLTEHHTLSESAGSPVFSYLPSPPAHHPPPAAGSSKPLASGLAADNTPRASYLRIALGFLVPGLPQYLQGKWRSYGFFAAEGLSITALVVLNSQGGERKNRYLQLAYLARTNYVFPGLRNNPEEIAEPSLPGFGEYYEDLTKWLSSGDYDNDPSLPGLQPETDTRTYDGHQWEIAKINNYSVSNSGLPVPANAQEEARALEAYRRACYPSQYNWDWTGLDREYDRYLNLFSRSEDAYRRRNSFIALLVANHLVSGIDMLIMERINRSNLVRAAGLEMHLELAPPAADRLRPRSVFIFSRSF